MESYLKAEISASAVETNLALLRRRIGPAVKICAVVKANCYGHGLETLLGLIAERADCLGVATGEEAIHLRALGYERPILMFFSPCARADGPELRDSLEELIAEGVTLTVVSAGEVPLVAAAARRVKVEAQVHVMIDAGMARSGIPADAAAALIGLVRQADGLRLRGLYTHFATADEADKSFTRYQLARFQAAVDAAGGRAGLTLHAANSSATIDLPETHLDMVRPGIAIYGVLPSDDLLDPLPLQPCLRLTGRLMQIKDVRAGSCCGYGLTYCFGRDSRVGLVPVGYGDGYMISLSDKATMRIRGRDVPVRGRVSMDQTIIDLTDVDEARVGDEVEIISADPASGHSVANLARLAGTIPYEITTRLGTRVRTTLVD